VLAADSIGKEVTWSEPSEEEAFLRRQVALSELAATLPTMTRQKRAVRNAGHHPQAILL
jgi:hypothetical protein